jgi:hypothetical protein
MQERTGGLLERIRCFAMPEGEIKCRGIRIRQEGEMRLTPNRPWLPFQAEQWFASASVDFQWRAWMRMTPFMPIRVVDSFHRGLRSTRAKFCAALPSFHGAHSRFARRHI